LTYGVLRRVESQIVNGDGTGENLTGVLNTSGIATVAFASASPLSDLTLDGVTSVLVADAEPNGVVLHPTDISTMLKLKTTGSGERLDSDGAFGSTPTTIWGLPVIPSRVIPQGKALVGDWAQGAVLYIREGVNIRVSDNDQDDFIRNRVTLLAEGRFALAVFRPACFALVNLK
jgi:HK97 family phage major capsid protein